MDDDELWGLPHFLDEDELMNDLENAQAPIIGKNQSTNSDSTCYSDFGNKNATSSNLIENFTGNMSYLQNIDGSLKLKRQNAIIPVKMVNSSKSQYISAQEAQQQTSDALHEAFFGN